MSEKSNGIKGIKAIENPLAGQKVNILGKEYGRETLSPEVNAIIDDIMAMKQELQKAIDTGKRLEGAIAYADQKLSKIMTAMSKEVSDGTKSEESK